MADLELYKDAIPTVDQPADGLRSGDVGTIVERHQAPGVTETGYSVEFFDVTGRTVAVVNVPANHLRVQTTADVPSVRALSKSPE